MVEDKEDTCTFRKCREVWEKDRPRECSRPDCVICNQGDEDIQDCKRRNIVYENRCTLCQVGGEESKDNGRGVYIGESARSLYERSKEHESDKEGRHEDSHQVKHWVLDHPELSAPPRFRFKLISSFKDALTRQITEAVRIERGGGEILNSKSEFNRCRIPRLRIDLEEWNLMKKKRVELMEIKSRRYLKQTLDVEMLKE